MELLWPPKLADINVAENLGSEIKIKQNAAAVKARIPHRLMCCGELFRRGGKLGRALWGCPKQMHASQ